MGHEGDTLVITTLCPSLLSVKYIATQYSGVLLFLRDAVSIQIDTYIYDVVETLQHGVFAAVKDR